MIWGDSHALHFAPIVDAINTDPERSFLDFAGCSAVLGGKLSITFMGGPQQMERCKEMQPIGLNVLKNDPVIDQVILTSNWLDLPVRIGAGDVNGGLDVNSSGASSDYHRVVGSGTRVFSDRNRTRNSADCCQVCPHRHFEPPQSPCVAAVRSSDAVAVMQKSAAIDNMFKELAKTLPNVSAVIPAERLCTKDSCDVYLDGEFLYLDIGHIRRNLRLQTRKDFADRIGLTAALSNQPAQLLRMRTP